MASVQTAQKENGLHDEAAGGNSLDSAAPAAVLKSKRKTKKAKKSFSPLPTLEAVQQKLPWHLSFSQKLGRHAIASKDLHAGQCILAEDAVRAVPTPVNVRNACHACLKPLPEGSEDLQLSQGVLLDKASKHYKRYCCQQCSCADLTANSTAAIHARVPQIAAETKCDATLIHFILELDAQRQRPSSAIDKILNSAQKAEPSSSTGAAAASSTGTTAAGSTESARKDPPDVVTCVLADVESLLAPFDRNQKGWRDAITAGCSALRQAIEQASTYEPGTVQQLQSLAACINANAHATGHQAETNSETGLGLYPVLSMFNHSCNPNLAHSSQGTVQYIYTVRDVKKGDQLCVHYTSIYEPRKVRQQALLQEKFFTCACERCSIPIGQSVDRFLEGISCSKGQCREVLLKDAQPDAVADVFKCVGCGSNVTGRNVDGTGPLDVEKQAEDLYNHAVGVLHQQGSAAARPIFEQVLESCQGPGKLHPMHVRIFDCYIRAANGCRRTGDSIGAIKHVTAMINAMEYYYSYPCIEVTNLYRFLTELYIDWASNAPSSKLASRPKKQAKESFQKYCVLRSVCQGSNDTNDDLMTRIKLL